MKKTLTIFLIVMKVSLLSAQVDLQQWSKTKETSTTKVEKTVFTFKPEMVDGKIILSGSIPIPGKTDKETYSSLMHWAAMTFKVRVIQKIDASKNLCMTQTSILSTRYNSRGTSYRIKTAYQVLDQEIRFQIFDISVSTLGSGLSLSYNTDPIESVIPDLSKPLKGKASVYLQELEKGCNHMLAVIFDDINNINIHPVTHWDAIEQGRVVKGMNATECKIAIGRPLKINTTSTSGITTEQWVYEDNEYLYFNNGILTTTQY